MSLILEKKSHGNCFISHPLLAGNSITAMANRDSVFSLLSKKSRHGEHIVSCDNFYKVGLQSNYVFVDDEPDNTLFIKDSPINTKAINAIYSLENNPVINQKTYDNIRNKRLEDAFRMYSKEFLCSREPSMKKAIASALNDAHVSATELMTSAWLTARDEHKIPEFIEDASGKLVFRDNEKDVFFKHLEELLPVAMDDYIDLYEAFVVYSSESGEHDIVSPRL